MKECLTLPEGFRWYSPDKDPKFAAWGPPPSRKPELRKPLLWLTRDRQHGGSLFLVNDTGETLDSVEGSGAGFVTVEDNAAHIDSEKAYIYRDVPNGAAVKVEEYDDYYDLDYMLGVCVSIKSKQLGHMALQSPVEKGGISMAVLLWDTMEPGKNVYFRQVAEPGQAAT